MHRASATSAKVFPGEYIPIAMLSMQGEDQWRLYSKVHAQGVGEDRYDIIHHQGVSHSERILN